MTTPADFSIPPLQLRRGTDTAIMAYQAAEGEPIYNINTKEVRIGDGSTPGGIPILGSSGTYVFSAITATNAVFTNITVNQTATISKMKLDSIANSTSSNVLYYNASTKEVTYGTAPSGGGGSYDQSLNTTDSVTFAGLTLNSDNLKLGSGSYVDTYGIALGKDTTSTGYGVALGQGASANGGSSMALGKLSIASSLYSTALGTQSRATGIYATALGTTACANNEDTVAIGHLAGVSSSFTITNAINSIIINASGDNLTAANSGLYVSPIRSSTSSQILYYDATTKEITYGTNSGGSGGVTSITAGTGTYVSASTGNITIWTTSSGSSYDQSLNTTDNVIHKSLKTTGIVSSGGYPLDSNGQALLFVNNTQSAAMVVSNYTSGVLPNIQVRGWGQNRPGTVTSSTIGSSTIFLESSRGSTSTPYAPQSADGLGALSMGSFDGARWSSDINLAPFQIVAQATETWAGNSTTATNNGTRFFIRTQPQGIQLDATSRQIHMFQTWTAGSTSAPPTSNLLFGSGVDGNAPTLINSNGANSHTGWGATNVNWVNTKNFIFGTPSEETFTFTGSISTTTLTVTSITSSASVMSVGSRIYNGATSYGFITAQLTGTTGGTGTYTLSTSSSVSSGTLSHGGDNTTLGSTNYLMFVGGRKSGVTGRRNKMQVGDTLGQTLFFGQTADSATGTGIQGAAIVARSLDAWSASAQGTRLQFYTCRTGQTNASGNTLRLDLKDAANQYHSDSHIFRNAVGGTTVATFSTASTVLVATNVGFQTDVFLVNNAANTQQLFSAQDQQVVLGRSGANNLATFNTTSITFNNGAGVGVAAFYNTSTSFYDNGTQYAIFNRDVHKVWSDQHVLHNKAQDKQFASFENSQIVLSPNGTSIVTITTASVEVSAPITVSGLSSLTGQQTSSMNVGSTTYTIFSFQPGSYSGAKLVCKIKDNADLHMVEMLVISDGTNVDYNEYAVVTNNGDLGTFSATVSGSDVLVQFTTKAGISNANAKVSATLLA